MVGDEAGAADEQAVHAGDGEVGAGVGGIDAATIKNRQGFSNVGAVGVGQELAKIFKRGGDLFGGSEMSAGGGADGPDGFVGNDDAAEVFGGDFGEAAEQLVTQDIVGLAEGVFGGGFAEAEDGGDLVAEGGGDGGADVFVGEMEELAAFGVTDNTIIYQAAQLGAGNLAGVGTEIVRVGGLSGEADFLAVGLERERLERNAGGCDHRLKAARTA